LATKSEIFEQLKLEIFDEKATTCNKNEQQQDGKNNVEL
jgi:hypothetical protein